MRPATVAFVLHAHLPWVRETAPGDACAERWLYEALVDTYLPLLAMLDGLARDRIDVRFTLSLSPTLLAMLAERGLAARFEGHLERVLALAETERGRADPDRRRLASMYRDRFERARRCFLDAYRGDLIGPLRAHHGAARVEIITTAATHAVLPLLAPSPGWARLQIDLGTTELRRVLGVRTAGFWLPECGYDPTLDEHLRRAGLRYVVLDTHGLTHATPPPVYGPYAPIASPTGLITFARDPESARQVWSAEHGYPGDPWYRDFHRDAGLGLKYHRVTGPGAEKTWYDPERAHERLAVHAAHFVASRALQAVELARLMDRPPLLVCPYDAELFGHWWFEGMDWLDATLRLIAADSRLIARSLAEELDANPILQQATPAPSTWGVGGHLGVWLGADTAWVQPRAHQLGARLTALTERYVDDRGPAAGTLRRAIIELLLAQASDWTFMVSQGTTAEYGRARLTRHLARCDALCAALEAGDAAGSGRETAPGTGDLFPTLDPRTLIRDCPLSRRDPSAYSHGRR